MKQEEIAPSLRWPVAELEAQNLIGGEWVAAGVSGMPLSSPYNGTKLGSFFPASSAEVESAIAAAQKGYEEWRMVPAKERASRLFGLRNLLVRDLDRLSTVAALESGKTFVEARAELLKGVEVLEFALSLQNSDIGGALEVSRGVTCEYRREALGVTVGIVPFNFPAMVPMWMIPIALAVGNSFILKPSDKVPFTPCLLGELIREAGFPAGVFSIVHGGRSVVEHLITHPQVQAVGFVGSTPVARSVYTQATSAGKRALCLGGAKNHLIVVPDADYSIAVDGILASFTGCAGQRCMAASVLVAVGDVDRIIDGLIDSASKMQLGRDMGALIDQAAHTRLTGAIERAAKEGAVVRLDGRTSKAPVGCERGIWLGPTVIDGAHSSMQCACDELFGPVLTIVRVKTLDEALQLERNSVYGNALSVFTSSGHVARYVSEHATSGMIGVNVGVPVPREPFSFGGTKSSKFGGGDITGFGGVEFWSNRKKITTKWAPQSDKNWMS
jgi:malonate-semialdehyde dehydrogenase (acetylating)/methylmalonate-semialdehyde dehydrogenase